MHLKERLKKEAETIKSLNLETFGEIIDKYIDESEIVLVIYKKAGDSGFDLSGDSCGPVIDLYTVLKCLKAIYRSMVEMLGGHEEFDADGFANAIAELVEEDLKEAVQDGGEEDDHAAGETDDGGGQAAGAVPQSGQ
jgi:hypothetical protein